MTKKDHKTSDTLIGHISISGKGIGYFNTQPEKGRDGESWEIQKEFLNHAFPGDTVEVRKRAELFYGRPQAEVVSVVSHAKMEFVGTIEMDPEGKSADAYVVPDDRRMYVDIKVKMQKAKGKNEEKEEKMENGMKVLVKITEWKKDADMPEGEILEIIGRAGENETEMRAIALEKGFRSQFPEEVEESAHQIKKEESDPKVIAAEIKNRRDMRDTWTCTIDPADAKDFDDALSIKKLDDHTYEIGVHIADVSYFVRPGTALDTEALKRACSVYLVDRTIPMLPEILSNDLCSLNPNEDKYTFSAVFHITESGDVIDRWFGRTVIHSDKRFSYEEAQ
ncbi:MAG: RNB domain-containing ribonuclease, partial [Bacillota bacterium]|nr:RNB domain-containing ribonuclease [Bacillota bacterium]